MTSKVTVLGKVELQTLLIFALRPPCLETSTQDKWCLAAEVFVVNSGRLNQIIL